MQTRSCLHRNHISLIALACVLLLLAFAATMLLPATAHAKSYSMPYVDIHASLNDEGDLDVIEERTFDFDGNFTAVWWFFDNLPEDATVAIEGASLTVNDKTTVLPSMPFKTNWRSSGGPDTPSYSFDGEEDTVYVFFDLSDQTATITLHYQVLNAVQVYNDTAELYWQFVGENWAEPSDNVSLTLDMPLPTDATVEKGETLSAWGHGPLDATIEIDEDTGTITCEVPDVPAGTYAELRIAADPSWFSGVKAQDLNAHFDTNRLSTIKSEEQAFAEQANQARITMIASLIVAVVICLAICIWALWSFRRYGKELKPTFTEKYWRDVPVKGEQPAVIGRLIRFDKESNDDLTATILHLVNEGAILINKGSYERNGLASSKKVDDYYLTQAPDHSSRLKNEIDRLAFDFLFEIIGAGAESIWLSQITLFAKDNPETFSNKLADWQGEVTARTINGKYFEPYSKAKRAQTFTIGIVVLAIFVVVAFLFNNFLVLIPGVITMAFLLILSHFMDRRTQKGADAYAKCEALKRWLKDFSRLKERPVLDIKVWGEFLVYAYLFGIADEVIDELRNTVPELFANDATVATNDHFVPWWIIYSSHSSFGNGVGSFANMFTNSLDTSLTAIQSAAAGNFSSGSGIGGGFSMGGGGGFGGGGGAR